MVAQAGQARAQDVPVDLPVPSRPATQSQAANPIDSPITEAAIAPTVTGIDPGLSLEALMAVRPGYPPKNESGDARDAMVRQAAWAAGARGGLYAQQTAIRALLDRYAAVLDRTFDFRTVLKPIGGGGSLFRPPMVTKPSTPSGSAWPWRPWWSPSPSDCGSPGAGSIPRSAPPCWPSSTPSCGSSPCSSGVGVDPPSWTVA